MTFLLIIITTIIFTFAGFALLELFGFLKEETLLAKLSYSWGLGVGLIAFQLFLYSICNIRWSLVSILIPWVILFTIYSFNKLKKPNFPKVKIKLKLSRFETVLTILILVLVFFTGFESILRPVQAWDGWDNWVLRPKVFYLNNNLSMDYIHYTHDDYPLVIPLMGTFGYIVIGGINDKYILFLFFMFYLALGGLFFSYSRKKLGTKKALVLTFLLLSLQNIIRYGGRYEAGQADLAVGYYFFACASLLLDVLKKINAKTLLLLSILLGITAQIKNEGMPFFIIVNTILFIFLILQKKYKYLFLLLPSFLILLPWELYKMYNHFPTDFLFVDGIYPHWDKMPAIFIAMAKEFINFQNWTLLWIVFFITLIICWRYLSKVKILLMLIFFQWFSYYAIFMITPRDPVGHVENVINVLYIHLAPIVLLIIGILVNYQISKLKKSSIWRKYIE